jgi:teichuronic acid biosynthesis glycosyltransferase TuaH
MQVVREKIESTKMLKNESKIENNSILYLSTLDWGNTKQRPQYTAEYLARANYIVKYVTINRVKRGLGGKTGIHKNIKILKAFIFSDDRRISFLNVFFRLHAILILGRYHEYLFITSPMQYAFIKKMKIRARVIIYDCMDNILEFYSSAEDKRCVMHEEERLCKDSQVITVSCKEIKSLLLERYGVTLEKIFVINNGYEPSVFNENAPQRFNFRHPNVVYTGTVAKWLDIKAICELAQTREDLTIYLIGPLEKDSIKLDFNKYPNIVVFGAILFSFVASAIKSADAVMIPFRINELTRCIDPVKAYEYIAMGKTIVSSYWKEMEKFRKFSLFYEEGNGISLREAIEKCLRKENTNKKDAISFAEAATWENRISRIIEIMKRY